jgi:hypothetical protein
MWVPAWSGAGASSKLQLLLRQELYNTLLGAYIIIIIIIMLQGPLQTQ